MDRVEKGENWGGEGGGGGTKYLELEGICFCTVVEYQLKTNKPVKLRSRAGVDGVGDPFVRRAAAGRVELDAEVFVGAARVVASAKKQNARVQRSRGGPVTCCRHQ